MIDINIEDLSDGIKLIRLGGSLDIEGTEKAELQLTKFTSMEKTYVILDLGGLTLLASLGIGLIYRCLKSLRLRGGNMVLLHPQPGVALVLERTNSSSVIPILDNFEEARKIVTAAPR